ncbi:MAG TPA: glycine betaine ABC transporter substrate-binding protein [Solirubrobacteraceae bacterium]|nr:glycine betaine ABC transporter substrate-binding protein [Solirubrobacteraceae bacterium]
MGRSALRPIVLSLGLCLLLAFGGCGGSDDDDPPVAATTPDPQPIRIGTKNFTEQRILGELYRQALEAKGYEVELKSDIGSSEIVHRVLRRGALDMYPEYIGVLLSEVAQKTDRPPSDAAAYDAARAFERRNGFTLLDQTPFADENALAVKPQFARRHGLRTIADLRKLEGTVKVAALAEFATRFEGLVGLEKLYKLRRLDVVEAEGSERYTLLDGGDVDVASVFTSEGQLAGDDYRVLEDPERLFASGRVAPVVNDEVLATHGDGLRAAIDAVSRELTTSAMRKMNGDVDLREREPAAVAAEFLRAKGLT